jgi:hypothetical protein
VSVWLFFTEVIVMKSRTSTITQSYLNSSGLFRMVTFFNPFIMFYFSLHSIPYSIPSFLNMTVLHYNAFYKSCLQSNSNYSLGG